jgi:hypothetical protein
MLKRAMAKRRKIILRLIPGNENRLEPFVEQCLRDGVKFVAVMGDNCARIEELIDELVVGDGSDDGRFILTSSHPDERLESVIDFASSLTGEYEGEVEVIEL